MRTVSSEPSIELIQYWDTPDAPEEVVDLMDIWAREPGFLHVRYDQNAARKLIQEHFSRRTLDAFDACRVPAMQADLFRYAALYAHGGLYVDADIRSLGGVADLLAGDRRGRMVLRDRRVANDFIFVREPGDPLMSYAVQKATENIHGRVSNDVWAVTGPWILTELYNKADETRDAWFEGFTLEPVVAYRDYLKFEWYLEYKQGEHDWRTARDKSESIFR